MKKTIFIAALLSIFNFQFSISSAQDAVFKLLKQEWTVNADGTSDYHYRHEVQILRNRALTAYADKGETFVVYNPDIEELTINEVYTIQKDGTRVNMPQNAFVYQLPSECADCGRFNHLRELAMVHTGMELGCTIVVDYTIHRHYNLLNETLQLVRECPIERLEVKVNVPSDMELNVTLNDPKVLDIKTVASQSSTSYELKLSDVPQTFVDKYLPPAALLYPTLHFFNGAIEFTAADDDRTAAEAKAAVSAAVSAAISTAGPNNDRDIIRAIHNFVVDNIHLNQIHPAHLGYVHATPAQVWQSGCGTTTDKAVLMAAMLEHQGFQARVIGNLNDEVAVRIDTLEYRLSVVSHDDMELIGEAKDEIISHTVSGEKAPALTPLEDGYYRLRLPALPGEPSVRATKLALTRTAPLMGQACDLSCNITIPLPKGMKMVKKSIAQKLSFDGIGTVEISIKQSGNKLKVVRNLKLDKSLIEPTQYAQYRQLLAVWQTSDVVLIKKATK